MKRRLKIKLEWLNYLATSSSPIGRFPVCAGISTPTASNLFELFAAKRAQLRAGIDFMTMILCNTTNVIQWIWILQLWLKICIGLDLSHECIELFLGHWVWKSWAQTSKTERNCICINLSNQCWQVASGNEEMIITNQRSRLSGCEVWLATVQSAPFS